MIKAFLRQILPPFLHSSLAKFKNESRIIFSGFYDPEDKIDDDEPWISGERLAEVEDKLDNINGDTNPQFCRQLGSLAFPCLMVNTFLHSKKIECKVLDFGGGSGIVYYLISDFFDKSKVLWHVVDNHEIINIGNRYKKKDDRILFFENLPQEGKYDIVFLNSCLQYIVDYRELLDRLLLFEPEFVIFTRLIAGKIQTFKTCQKNIQGGKTFSIFLSFDEVLQIFSAAGYHLFFQAPAIEDIWGDSVYEGIPQEHRLCVTLNVIFSKAT
jgi:putative methyltransferase (TIGR04325 family)